MQIHASRILLAAVIGVALTACGKPHEPTHETSARDAQDHQAPDHTSAASPQTDKKSADRKPAEEDHSAHLPRTASPAGATVTILSPEDGAVVTSPVKVVFGVEGITLAPAGDTTPNSGHHHLLIDVPAPDLGQPIPTDAQHLHFGKAQTEAEVTLEPGQHTLQLLLGDANHIPHDPPLISAPIVITVQ